MIFVESLVVLTVEDQQDPDGGREGGREGVSCSSTPITPHWKVLCI